ncbi:Methyltransf_11 domain-containing protein [Azospirillaceae bacterium]
MKDQTKDTYFRTHDAIIEKRVNSPYAIRRQVHADIYDSVLRFVEPGMRVLDAGCGEGALSRLMAEKGADVVGVDLSVANIRSAEERRLKDRPELQKRLHYLIGDLEQLPFSDNAFDCVVSSHVLEHLPDFDRGLSELHRLTGRQAVIAVPTCINPCSWALLGGDNYWRVGKRTPIGVPLGIFRVIRAWMTKADGVNEGYLGDQKLPHVFRFPSVVRRHLTMAGFCVLQQEAQSLRFPYVPLPIETRSLRRRLPSWGIGTVFLVKRKE